MCSLRSGDQRHSDRGVGGGAPGTRFAIPALALVATAILAAACSSSTALHLGTAERVAVGIRLYRLNDPNLLDPPGPAAVQVLRLNPAKVDLVSVTALDRVIALETVPEMAARHGAIAAINAGFFVVKTGEPAGLLKVGGQLISDTPLARGAVGIARPPGQRVRLLFGQVSASAVLRVGNADHVLEIPIDGVDTPRQPGLEGLDRGQAVAIETRFQIVRGPPPAQWEEADDIVGGAGMLMLHGRALDAWTEERLRSGFDTERHPRTLIGTSKNGTIWLITVDGRNPELALGMTFAELQHLATGLRLVNALNLDGGGSTTMVVHGKIVNHPSDATGPRKVSDGLIVVPRPQP